MNVKRIASFYSLAACVCVVSLLAAASPASAAEQYALDSAHTSVTFRTTHLNMSYVYGRFNDVQGQFSIDEQDPGSSTFSFTVKTESIDTAHQKRDEHLRSPDFLNAKQFPVITFQSTAVRATGRGYRVTGDLTLHGVTKSVTAELAHMGEGEDPWGNYRKGFASELTIQRSDFGMTHMPDVVGDDVHLMISFEGLRQ